MLAWMEEMSFLLVNSALYIKYIFILNKCLHLIYKYQKYFEISNLLMYINKSLIAGREFFVGLSHFTNEAGARAVAAAFPEYPCVPIKVSKTIFNLVKSYKLIFILHDI